MRKIRILVLFFSTLLLLNTNVIGNVYVFNKSHDFIVHMNDPLHIKFRSSKKAISKLNKLIEDTNDSHDQLVAFQIISQTTAISDADKINWLKENAKKLSPPFLIYLATLIGDKDEKEAVQWYLVAKIRMFYDARKCTDNSAQAGIGAVSYILLPAFGKSMNLEGKPDGLFKKLIVSEIEPAIALYHSTGYTITKPYWIAYHGLNADRPDLFIPQEKWPGLEKKVISDLREEQQQASKDL